MRENGALSCVNRRDFVRVAMTSAGGLAAGGLSFLAACERSHSPIVPEPLARNPLRIPPAFSPAGLSLAARPGAADLGGGTSSLAWTYNGHLPGPTIRAKQGETASIQLQNGLPQETTIHWHGLIVPSLMDGHPHQTVQPGAGYMYQYPIVQRASMNWYHPHPHGRTGQQVSMGLTGAFIIEDSEETALALPSGMYEVPLLLRDANLDSSGNLNGQTATGPQPNIELVNGVRDARLEIDTALYRFRVLNGANTRVFRLALSTGTSFTLIGNDGGLLEAPSQLTEIELAPAERLDFIVDFSKLNVGESVMLRCLGANRDLLEFVVTRRVTGGGSIPVALPAIPKLLQADAASTREFEFEGMSKINGKVYDMHRVDFRVPFGQTERWRFTSKDGSAPHPIHVHGASFQVQSRSGGRGTVFPWERGWKDTVLLMNDETIDVLIRFDHYRGMYILHCHNLAHEDMGMMANFEVY